ncbi:MAG: (Fe-S)-binding protein [Candidatus Marinimicrobia bacterium]|nr:(Fe-S)-binding protein [Candidatus Neomarinimicrobiota bacterium]
MSSTLTESIKKTNAYACLECGKCTSVCPVALFRYNGSVGTRFSPRMMLTKAVRRNYDDLFHDYDLWSCLTCRKCDLYCPSNIHYIDLIQFLRSSATDSGIDCGKCSHSGALQALSRIMTAKDLKPNRLDWVTEDLEISTDGDMLYFVGCAPYFDAFFTDLDLSVLDAARSSIAILNKLGISPVLLDDERCCGHDLFWNGDVETFKRLAEYNVSAIKNAGIKTILFSCAECLNAFKKLYPENGFAIKAELKHMSQFLAEKISAGELELASSDKELTYHDPCRLGRHLGIYDEPRQVLSSNNDAHFYEMKQSGKRSLCCGVSAWMNCDITAKAIQIERLNQAKETGADVLAVACPKCQIHLICTLKNVPSNKNYEIEIRDISSITLERME